MNTRLCSMEALFAFLRDLDSVFLFAAFSMCTFAFLEVLEWKYSKQLNSSGDSKSPDEFKVPLN